MQLDYYRFGLAPPSQIWNRSRKFTYNYNIKTNLLCDQALYLLVNDKVMVSHSLTMAQAYDQFRGPDGYLHITYAAQQVFGWVSSNYFNICVFASRMF